MNRDSQFQLNSHYDVTTKRRNAVRQEANTPRSVKKKCVSQTTQSTIRRNSVRQEANTPRSSIKCLRRHSQLYDGMRSVQKSTRHEA